MAKKWWVLFAVACGTFMATLDSSIVNIALPTLTQDLVAPLNQVKWVIIAYLLGITCLLLPFGRLSDQYGRKRVFQYGFMIFIFGSALCGVAPTLGALVGFRVLQALGASMLMANGPAIITSAFPSEERGGALGTMAMVVSAGLICGPSIGGFLISSWGWRGIFWVNVPVGILGVCLAYRFITHDVVSKTRLPFDWAGAFLQVGLLLSFIVMFDPPNISISGSIPWVLPRWILLLITLTFAAVFFKVEADATAPLLDLTLMKTKVFWTANLAGFLTYVAYSSVTVLMPFFLEVVMRFNPEAAGLFMTAIPLTVFVVAPISGRLSDRVGSHGLSSLGALVGAGALAVMSGFFGMGIHDHISSMGIVLLLCSIGLAIGLFQSPNNNAIMGAVPTQKLGVASAMIATFRNLGLVTGTGLATSLFSWRMGKTHDFVGALHFTHSVAAIIGVGAVMAALGKGRSREHLHHHHPASCKPPLEN